MENIEEFKQKHINLNKFLFIYKEPTIHNMAFFGKLTLKAGVLIGSIINLISGTAFALHCIEYYTFLFFIGFFFPAIAMMAGSVLLMLSIENLEERKAYWGYILTAASVWLHVLLIALSMVMTFMYSPSLFFRQLIWNLTLIIFILAIYLYTSWLDYCYTKHLGAGNRELVETGKGSGLIDREHGPGVEHTDKTQGDKDLEQGKN